MYPKRIFIVIVLFFFDFLAFSQQDTLLIDSVEIITVYEYDTIYVQQDTIRLTDTIIDIIKNETLKETLTDIQKKSSISFLVPNSIGIHSGPFFSQNLFDKTINDTLSIEGVLNISISAQLNFQFKKYLLVLEFGYSPFHEKHKSTQSFNTSSVGNNGTYDSLMVSQKITADYYCNYFNISALFGKKWKMKNNAWFSLNLGCSADFLKDYKEGNTAFSGSNVRKYDIAATLLPNLSFKISKIADFCISGYYRHSLLSDNKLPYSTKDKVGIRLGLNFSTKKE